MSRGPRIKVSILVFLILMLAVSTHPSGVQLDDASMSAELDSTDELVTTLSKYRTWTLVNPAPVKMKPAVSLLCAAVMPANPHREKFISVYVNEIGREAMTMQLAPTFPKGSTIVKEKLASTESRSPELLTAMIKRQKGFNPKSGDWEYLVLDGTASTITKRGRLTDCSGCHFAYQTTDYVTRTYLSEETRRQLR